MMTMTHATTRWLGKTEFSLFKYHRLQIWHKYMSAAPSPTSATPFSSFSNARSFRRELNRKLLTTETQSIHVYTFWGAFSELVNAKMTFTATVYVVRTGLREKKSYRISRIPDITYWWIIMCMTVLIVYCGCVKDVVLHFKSLLSNYIPMIEAMINNRFPPMLIYHENYDDIKIVSEICALLWM